MSIPDSSTKSRIIRRRYTEEQKHLMRQFFKDYIKEKKAPKKQVVVAFMEKNKEMFKDSTWIKIKAFVFNCYRTKC